MLFPTTLLVLALQAAVTKAYTIAIVPKNTNSEDFYGLTFKGCQDVAAMREDDVKCIYRGTPEADIEGSVRIINELIDDPDVDAISVSVLDPYAYNEAIARGMEAGMPILTFDSDAPTSKRLAYVGTDNKAMGRELAKLLKQIKPDGGTYGIVSGLGQNLIDRSAGVREVLEDSPWVEVAASPKNGQEDIKISLEKMWEIVEENPDVDAVVSCVGLPMFDKNTTDWKNFVDSNRNVLTVIADTLPIQLELMQVSYVDALVGQLPYGMGRTSAEVILKALDDMKAGIPMQGPDASGEGGFIRGTHQLEVLRIPLELPPLDFNYNYIGNLAIAGYVLCSIIVAASLGFMFWTWYYRKHQVVRASQPIFLIMIAFGCLLMGSAIIPMTIDDKKSEQAADIACVMEPWLTNMGFTVCFSALFSKTWRLNKIFLSPNPLRRIKVTEQDVMLPFIVLLTINIITLTCWTVIAPLQFVRTQEDGTDPWNRPIGSYGQCRSTSGAAGDSIPYLTVLAVVNVSALVVANYQAYRARNVRTDFNESSYIAMANASLLQAIFVCVPVIFLTRDNPQAYFIVLSIVLFLVPAAVLLFIFVPKMMALKTEVKAKNDPNHRRSTVRISGLMDSATSRGNSSAARGSMGSSFRTNSSGGCDPVKDMLQQYQYLSFQDKALVLQKLGATATPTASTPSMDQSASSMSSRDKGSSDGMEPTESTEVDMTERGDSGMDVIPESRESHMEEIGASKSEENPVVAPVTDVMKMDDDEEEEENSSTTEDSILRENSVTPEVMLVKQDFSPTEGANRGEDAV